jgi:thymidine phosphorylase
MGHEAGDTNNAEDAARLNVLHARRLGIETLHEAIAFMHADCHVCRAEGFNSHARIRITHERRSIVATLYRVTSDLVGPNEVGLSESAWRRLGLSDGSEVAVSHPPIVESFGAVRGKVYGRPLQPEPLRGIIRDVLAGHYSDIQLSSFITACAARPLELGEVVALTQAMVDVGERLAWPTRPVMDKHCIGGLPGNRTTPIIVAIVAARGLMIPKTSSRAITSPAGTADTMETMAPVDLDTVAMRRVVEQEGGCVIWGGAVRLSPADDRLIRVERALNLDSGGQLVASVLSKKIAAGATHLVLDLPVGATAKVRSEDEANALRRALTDVATAFGIEARVVVSDGSEPVGRRIGPALEAHDVLAVLQGKAEAPADLRERALALAGTLLELGGAAPGTGRVLATATLADGSAWRKFQRICEAQGGMREPPVAPQRRPVTTARPGTVSGIDNRRLAQMAKLAGAPDAKAAGIELLVRIGDRVGAREPLFAVHAETRGELAYAMEYLQSNPGIVTLDDR